MTAVYQATRFWSPTTGDWCWRVSMPDAHCRELFVIIDDGTGQQRRARKAAAIEAIQAAIERGDQPGEVRVPPEVWRRSVDGYMQEGAA